MTIGQSRIFLGMAGLVSALLLSAMPDTAASSTAIKTAEAVEFFNRTCGASLPSFSTAEEMAAKLKGQNALRLRASSPTKRKHQCSVAFSTDEDRKVVFAVIDQLLGPLEGRHDFRKGTYQSTKAVIEVNAIVTSGGASGLKSYQIRLTSRTK